MVMERREDRYNVFPLQFAGSWHGMSWMCHGDFFEDLADEMLRLHKEESDRLEFNMHVYVGTGFENNDCKTVCCIGGTLALLTTDIHYRGLATKVTTVNSEQFSDSCAMSDILMKFIPSKTAFEVAHAIETPTLKAAWHANVEQAASVLKDLAKIPLSDLNGLKVREVWEDNLRLNIMMPDGGTFE